MATKIKMIATSHGVNDGEVYPTAYEEGKTYVVGGDLARSFADQGVCKILETQRAEFSAADEGEPAEVAEADISKMNKAQLLAVAEQMGLVVDESAKKADIIAAIEAAAPQTKDEGEPAE